MFYTQINWMRFSKGTALPDTGKSVSPIIGSVATRNANTGPSRYSVFIKIIMPTQTSTINAAPTACLSVVIYRPQA